MRIEQSELVLERTVFGFFGEVRSSVLETELDVRMVRFKVRAIIYELVAHPE